MSINKWRIVMEETEYTKIQCLNCYNQWCGETPRNWKFCPFCATQWIGEQEWEKKYYTSRKKENAYEYIIMERRVFAEFGGYWKLNRSFNSYYGPPTVQEVLREWKDIISDTKEYNEQNKSYCVDQLKLIVQYPDGKEKVIFEYLPEIEGIYESV